MQKEPRIMDAIEAIIRVGGRRWDVRLNNGITIKFPENELEDAWDYLIRLERDEKILERAIEVIDLRVEGKLYIQPKS